MNRLFFGIHIFQVMASLVNLVYDSLQPSQRSLSGRSAVAQRSLSGRCVYKESGSPSWTLDQPGTVTVGSGPRTLAGPR